MGAVLSVVEAAERPDGRAPGAQPFPERSHAPAEAADRADAAHRDAAVRAGRLCSAMEDPSPALGPSLDELRQARDRGEDLAADLLALDLDPELLLEGHHQLQGVHRIEPQALAEQRSLVLDHLRPHPFEVEALDDQVLDPAGVACDIRKRTS